MRMTVSDKPGSKYNPRTSLEVKADQVLKDFEFEHSRFETVGLLVQPLHVLTPITP